MLHLLFSVLCFFEIVSPLLHAMIVPHDRVLQAPHAFIMTELTQGWSLHEADMADAEHLPVHSVPTKYEGLYSF